VDGRGQILPENFGIRPLSPPKDVVANSSVLSTLPLYRQDLEIEPLTICRGIGIDLEASRIFIELRMLAKTVRSIRRISGSITTESGSHDCIAMLGLSQWVLVREIPSEYNFTATNTEDVNLETLSLLNAL